MEPGDANRHFPIFVGSTFVDLQPYRQAVREALGQLETIVRGMEYFGSKPGSPVEECLKVVRSCKVYIGIFGMRYGSVPAGYQRSMVHLEYDEAQKLNLPSLIYVLDEENQPVLPKHVETGDGAKKLKVLKSKLLKVHTCSFFTTPEDLASKVLHDVPELLKGIGAKLDTSNVLEAAKLLATKLPDDTPDLLKGIGGNVEHGDLNTSDAVSPSMHLKKAVRAHDEDNLAWIARNLTQDGGTNIVIVGGRSQTSSRLRGAQAHVRHDLTPSWWSHAMLLAKPAKNLASASVYEISLEPPQCFGFPPNTNAVQRGKLGVYRDPFEYPNIAVLNVPVSLKEVMRALQRFQMRRAGLEAISLLVRWLAYVWGVRTSPLLERHGIPSAVVLNVVFGAVGFDLTPGLEMRSSSPEAIWQAAKWWHNYYEEQNRECLTGAYYVVHSLE